MSRSDEYEQGRRNAIKACIEWLHAEAATMNDPRARGILNTAAFHMGVQFKHHNPVQNGPTVTGPGTNQKDRP